jgi:hypothetical protein
MATGLSRIGALAVGASLLGGLLAGMAANKVLVELPAWAEVGATAWATFSRATDNGPQRWLFPVIGGGALLLTVATAVAFHFDRTPRQASRGPVYLAAVLAVVALLETVFLLAPPRLGLVGAGHDLGKLQSLLTELILWWDVKAFLHVLTFGLNLWALVAILAPRGTADRMDTGRWPTTRDLLVAATFIGGLLAGFNLDRSLVHNPAWRELGPASWAAYSRHADLNVRAALLYPFLGIGMALLGCAAAVRFYRDRGGPRSAAIPIYATAILAASGLMVTFLAAPNMLSVPRLADDPVGLQKAMEGFIFWGDIRGLLQTLAFFASLWSLAMVTKLGAVRLARKPKLAELH